MLAKRKYLKYLKYSKELLHLAMPIIMGNIGFIMIGAGDILIAGHHSTDTLAAVSLATAITNCIMIFGIGLLSSVSPILSNIRGQRKSAKKYFYPTIRFSLATAFFIMLAILAVVPLVKHLGIEPHLVKPVEQYILITAFASYGGYLHAALKEFLQAYEIVIFPNALSIICIFLNLALNYILVFGIGPFPELGAAGLAIASLLVRLIMGVVLYIYSISILRLKNYYIKKYYSQLIKIGLPISFAILIEFTAFNIVAILMGRISGAYAAAQNIICLATTVSFMIPLALSNAIAIKVGFANGAKILRDVKRYSIAGIGMSEAFMLLSGLVFISFPNFLVRLFTTDHELIKICVPIFYILAIFQIFDGLQVSLGGIFKGLKKTKIVMLTNLTGYWGISIPIGAFCAFALNLKLIGFWIGLTISSGTICIIMSILLFKYLKNQKAASLLSSRP